MGLGAYDRSEFTETSIRPTHLRCAVLAPDCDCQRVPVLTPKETEVLGLLNRGMTYRRIALTLNVGRETVKWHIKNLYLKLSASSRFDALESARLRGLICA